MEKNYYAAIEINAIYSTCVVVAFHNNLSHVIAVSKTLTSGFGDGRIFDEVLFQNTISNLLDDINAKFKFKIQEAIIILPNNNHKVYSASVDNRILTERQIIGLAQINYSRSKIREAEFTKDEVLVDEVPTLYTLDCDRTMRTMPLNYQSQTLRVTSNLHTLPVHVVNGLLDEFQKNHIHVLASYINCYCNALAVSKQYELEDNCICIHISQDITTISAFSKNLLARSVRVNFGVKTLIDYLSKMLNIPFKESLELFQSYFIADIDYTSDVIFDKENKINEKRISGIVLNSLYGGLDLIKEAVEKLRNDVRFDESCKYNLSGLLNNYEYFIDTFIKYTNISVTEGKLDKVGISDAIYDTCFGALKLFYMRNSEFILKRMEDDNEVEDSLPSFPISTKTKDDNISKSMQNNTQEKNTSSDANSRFRDIFDD